MLEHDPTTPDAQQPERCARCRRPLHDAATVSGHYTSGGLVRYLRCACGALAVEVDGAILQARRDETRVGGGSAGARLHDSPTTSP